jgi:chromate reductase
MKKILLISTSLRKDSLNTKLVKLCAKLLSKIGAYATVLDSEKLNVPLVNMDIPAEKFPSTIKEVSDLIIQSDGVIISQPEYNGSISPVLKNLIDWASTLEPHPWTKKPILLCATSPGYFGGIRCLLHSRQPLEVLGAYVYPMTYALPSGNKEIGEDSLNTSQKHEALEKTLKDFLAYISADLKTISP